MMKQGATMVIQIAAMTMAVVAATSCGAPAVSHDLIPSVQSDCAAASAPSGVSVPLGDLHGWRQIFTDDFDRCSLGSNWGTYSGQPGGNPEGLWDPSMVRLQEGMLVLQSERSATGWVSGGVSNNPIAQQYGRWEIRMRADRSDDISYHMLLWPADDGWPPEIDFAESVSGARLDMSAFLHWADENGAHAKAEASTTGDFSQWHTVGVEWAPGVVRFLLNGNVWAESHSEEMVPNQPMRLAMQAEAGACERRIEWGLPPCSTPEALRPDRAAVDVDWVAVYEAVPDQLEQMQRAGQLGPSPSAVQMTAH